MTTIAYRNGVMAGDSLITTPSGSRDGHTQKLIKLGKLLAGAAGPIHEIRAFLDWLTTGAKDEPPKVSDDFSGLIIIDGDVIACEAGKLYRQRVEYTAIGSGARVAIGAMAAGSSAESAVHVAREIDVYTGGDITVLRS